MNLKRMLKKLLRTLVNYPPLPTSQPYNYARLYYWRQTGKCLSYRHPKGWDQKLFWYNRYWQHPLIVKCADKVAVRDYVKECGFESILTKFYGVYDRAEDIDFDMLPDQFVLKTNHSGAGWFINICKDKSSFDCEAARDNVARGIECVSGLEVADYQYQYIKPKIIAEEFIVPSTKEGQRLEIQFFFFNGEAKHILVRNDLGDAAENSFAISYDMNWNRVHDRKIEDMSINVDKPRRYDEMLSIAKKLAEPFPHVRVDLYYVDDRIIFGELTFSTSGKILVNYPDETIQRWGDEWTLPEKLNMKWSDYYKSQVK